MKTQAFNPHRVINLTQRENQVLHLISKEYNSGEIAQELFISQHTVTSHRRNLLIKFKAKNSVGLIRKAMELNYV